jgi:hypothetical protein
MSCRLKQSLRVIAAICIILFCAGRYYHSTIAIRVSTVLNGAPCDFLPYYQAAQHIVHGESPFLADGYIYPPLLAFLLTPLARLDYVTARSVWFAISQLFLIASAVLLWRFFGRDWASACWIAFVWALGGAAGEALAVGQVGPLLMLLIVVALCCRRSQRGAGVALGFALKLFPGLLGLAVVFRGERRAVRTMISTALVAVLLPWVTVAVFLRGPLGFTKGSAWAGTPATLSWSLPSVVLRLLDPAGRSYLLPRNWMLGTNLEHFRLPFALTAAGLAIALLTLGAGLFALTRSAGFRLREGQVRWAMAALVPLALVASPVAWTHYQVLQYPGVALLLIYTWRQRQWVQLIIVLALAALIYPIPIHVLDAFPRAYHDGNSLSSLYIWTSVTPAASLGLFGMFVRRAGKAARSANPSMLIQGQLHRFPVSRVPVFTTSEGRRIENPVASRTTTQLPVGSFRSSEIRGGTP